MKKVFRMMGIALLAVSMLTIAACSDDDDTTGKTNTTSGGTIDLKAFNFMKQTCVLTQFSYDATITSIDDFQAVSMALASGDTVEIFPSFNQTMEDNDYRQAILVFKKGDAHLLEATVNPYNQSTQYLNIAVKTDGSSVSYFFDYLELTQDNEKVYIEFDGDDDERVYGPLKFKAYVLKSNIATSK